MKKIILSLICIASVSPVFAAGTNQLADEKSRISYALGMNMGTVVKKNSIDLDAEMYLRGLQDARAGGPTLLTEEEVRKVLTDLQSNLRTQQQGKNKSDGAAFLAANKNNPGVVVLPDGLQYLVITNGTGETPTALDTVTVNYSGTLVDGTEFDSSYKRGQPATFPVRGVIPGWTEVLQKMTVGSKWKVFIPSELAYGERGRPGIPPNATLIFVVELLDTKHPAPPVSTQAPSLTSDIIKVPSTAEMSNGATIQVLKPEDVQKMQQQQSK